MNDVENALYAFERAVIACERGKNADDETRANLRRERSTARGRLASMMPPAIPNWEELFDQEFNGELWLPVRGVDPDAGNGDRERLKEFIRGLLP